MKSLMIIQNILIFSPFLQMHMQWESYSVKRISEVSSWNTISEMF